MASSFGQYADRAARQALLRFGPQRSNLAELIREAQDTYSSRRSAAHSSAVSTKGAINRAIPQVRHIYSGADAAQSGATQLLTQALQGADPNSPIRQSATAESANALQRLIASRAAEEGRLNQQKVSAQEGVQFADLTAQGILSKELRSLLRKRTDLSGEEGAWSAEEADKLAQQDAKEQREDAYLGLAQAKGKREANNASGKKPDWQTADKQDAARSEVRKIEHRARALRGSRSRSEILEILTSEHPAETVRVPQRTADGRVLKKKDKFGKWQVQYEAQTEPAISAHDQLFAEAAIDSVYGYGRVSRPVLKKLHKAGYQISHLGLEPPARPAKRRRPKTAAPSPRYVKP